MWLFIKTPIIINIRTMVWRFKSAFIEKFIWDLSPVSLDFFFFLIASARPVCLGALIGEHCGESTGEAATKQL